MLHSTQDMSVLGDINGTRSRVCVSPTSQPKRLRDVNECSGISATVLPGAVPERDVRLHRQ